MLNLNQSTIVEAVQLLLNKEYKEGYAPKVLSVESDTSKNVICFVIKVESKEKQQVELQSVPTHSEK